MKKVTLVVCLLLIAGFALLMTGRQPQPFYIKSESASRLQPGPASVAQYDETFVDESRPTQANGEYPGDTSRRMEGTVWYPEDDPSGPYPLIVYSHGFSSTKEEGAYLTQQLATLGYVVVAVNYPLTNYHAPGGPNVRDVVNQPADVSFLIDTLVEQSRTAGHVLTGLIDDSRIGVVGLSLGGMTTELVTYHPTMRDTRIGAALSIAGPTFLFTREFFKNADIPFLMLAGDIDALVPYAANAAPVLDKIPGSQLVTIKKGSHTGFAGTASLLRWLNNPDSLGCWMVKRRVDERGPWYDLIGTPEQGIDYSAVSELCLLETLPEAINPLLQQMITSVVVSSFFQSYFSPSAEERDSARLYFGRHIERELSDVGYRRAPR